MKDKYAVRIEIEEFKDAQYEVGRGTESRDVAIRFYGEIKRNYKKPEKVHLQRLKEGGKWQEVVLSDIEKELIE